jgi:glyoxylase-like metal-dependent hydrolase (beta-lactamase superfamily II)
MRTYSLAIAMSVATEPRPAALPIGGGEAGATVKVHPILTGEMHAPPAFTARASGRFASARMYLQALGRRTSWNWLPIPAFLIEHPGAGAILVDTGLHQSCATDVAGNMGRSGKVLYEIRMDHDQALRFQLPRRGVEPTDVGVVIMTHLHIDHASAVSEFPQATFLVDRREWETAAKGRALQGYHARQFDHAFDWRTLEYTAEPVESFAGFAQTLDLFGDGSVRLVSTPGHTAGHQSVVLRTSGGEVLLTADAAYTELGLRGEAMPFVIHDEHHFRRSLKEIQRYVEQTPEAVVIPGHDWNLWPRLKDVYE